MRNNEISDRLHVSLHTVTTHVVHILAKLNAQDRTAAVDHALELGWLMVP